MQMGASSEGNRNKNSIGLVFQVSSIQTIRVGHFPAEYRVLWLCSTEAEYRAEYLQNFFFLLKTAHFKFILKLANNQEALFR